MTTWKKLALGTGTLLLLAVVAFVMTATKRSNLRYADVDHPAVVVSNDPAVIERGAYLVHGPSHCGACHLPEEDALAIQAGDRPPLLGGFVWELPFGSLVSPNITPHPTSGIGAWTDGELARVIRTGVRRDGRLSLFMAIAGPNMADDDIAAVISYLRTVEPVQNELPESELNLIGSFFFGSIPPRDGAPPFPRAVAAGPSVERGEYLAHGPAHCYDCHTELAFTDNMKPLGPAFGGGPIEPDRTDSSMEIAPPNITSHATGYLSKVDEDAFVARLKGGRTVSNSKMPWESYESLTDDDARAIYRYLKTVEPVDADTGPAHRPKGWTPES